MKGNRRRVSAGAATTDVDRGRLSDRRRSIRHPMSEMTDVFCVRRVCVCMRLFRRCPLLQKVHRSHTTLIEAPPPPSPLSLRRTATATRTYHSSPHKFHTHEGARASRSRQARSGKDRRRLGRTPSIVGIKEVQVPKGLATVTNLHGTEAILVHVVIGTWAHCSIVSLVVADGVRDFPCSENHVRWNFTGTLLPSGRETLRCGSERRLRAARLLDCLGSFGSG